MNIARVFFDVDMRCNFDGLKSLLKKNDMEPEKIKGHVIFMNRANTKFKLLAGEYLVYYSNGNRRIPLSAIQYLPTSFDGRELNLDKAMSRAIFKDLSKRLRIDS